MCYRSSLSSNLLKCGTSSVAENLIYIRLTIYIYIYELIFAHYFPYFTTIIIQELFTLMLPVAGVFSQRALHLWKSTLPPVLREATPIWPFSLAGRAALQLLLLPPLHQRVRSPERLHALRQLMQTDKCIGSKPWKYWTLLHLCVFSHLMLLAFQAS